MAEGVTMKYMMLIADAEDGMEWASISSAVPNCRWVCSTRVDKAV